MPLFFFSYARADANANPYVDKFFDDLASLVCLQSGLASREEAAFRDVRSIKLGDPWPSEIGAALASSSAIVSLLSPGYFNSEWCRKELAFFLNLASAKKKQGEVPPLIVPIRWFKEPKNKPFPKVVMDLQNNAEFGKVYEENGLERVMRFSAYKDDYEKIYTTIADRIVDATANYGIPDVPAPADLAAIPDLPGYGQNTISSPVDVNNPEPADPRRVQFILAAASQQQLRGIRNRLDAYGASGEDWRPYMPTTARRVALMLQAVATDADIVADFVTEVDDLIPRLEQALKQKNMVIIVLDPWALQVDTYAKALEEYDGRDFLHCAVVVPWNETDQETASAGDDLRALLKEKLKTKVVSGDPKKFRAGISSPEELTKGVSELLVELRKRIIEGTAPVRKIKDDKVIAKPVISAVRS